MFSWTSRNNRIFGQGVRGISEIILGNCKSSTPSIGDLRVILANCEFVCPPCVSMISRNVQLTLLRAETQRAVRPEVLADMCPPTGCRDKKKKEHSLSRGMSRELRVSFGCQEAHHFRHARTALLVSRPRGNCYFCTYFISFLFLLFYLFYFVFILFLFLLFYVIVFFSFKYCYLTLIVMSWISPWSNIQQNNSCMATCLTSRKNISLRQTRQAATYKRRSFMDSNTWTCQCWTTSMTEGT